MGKLRSRKEAMVLFPGVAARIFRDRADLKGLLDKPAWRPWRKPSICLKGSIYEIVEKELQETQKGSQLWAYEFVSVLWRNRTHIRRINK